MTSYNKVLEKCGYVSFDLSFNETRIHNILCIIYQVGQNFFKQFNQYFFVVYTGVFIVYKGHYIYYVF